MCSGDCVVDRVFRDSVLGDLEINDASIVDDCIAVMIVLYLWIQYENV